MSHLIARREDRIQRFQLNRPEKRNALNLSLCRDLTAALIEAGRDPGVGAILLEAAPPLFSNGWDIEELPPSNPGEMAQAHHALFAAAASVSKPVVAAVQGAALGAGMALVAMSHVAVAAQGTSFGMTDIRLGLFPSPALPLLERAVGPRRALELCLTGRVFSATDALVFGLVHHVAPAFEYDDLALNIADGLSRANPEALRTALARDIAYHDALSSAAFQEGVRAVRENRPPKWPPC